MVSHVHRSWYNCHSIVCHCPVSQLHSRATKKYGRICNKVWRPDLSYQAQNHYSLVLVVTLHFKTKNAFTWVWWQTSKFEINIMCDTYVNFFRLFFSHKVSSRWLKAKKTKTIITQNWCRNDRTTKYCTIVYFITKYVKLIRWKRHITWTHTI